MIKKSKRLYPIEYEDIYGSGAACAQALSEALAALRRRKPAHYGKIPPSRNSG